MESNLPEIQKKKFNLQALISLISGLLSYVMVLFHSLVDMSTLLALILAPITALIAIFTGHRAKRNIRRSDDTVSGKKMANTGLVLGYLYFIIAALLLVLAVVLFGEAISGISTLLGNLGIK